MKRAFSVFYREEDGELVSVEMAEHFRRSTPLLRADVLLDAIHDLIRVYNNTLKEESHAKGKRSEDQGKRRGHALPGSSPGGQARP
jgi:hypothetical protein